MSDLSLVHAFIHSYKETDKAVAPDHKLVNWLNVIFPKINISKKASSRLVKSAKRYPLNTIEKKVVSDVLAKFDWDSWRESHKKSSVARKSMERRWDDAELNILLNIIEQYPDKTNIELLSLSRAALKEDRTDTGIIKKIMRLKLSASTP